MGNSMKEIAKRGLQVGQWVQFRTEKPLERLSPRQKKIYQPDQYYLVLTREDYAFDPGCCFLVDKNGGMFDYCPRTHELGYVSLEWEDKIMEVDTALVELEYGQEVLNTIYSACYDHLARLSSYLKDRHVELLDLSKLKKDQTTDELLSASSSTSTC